MHAAMELWHRQRQDALPGSHRSAQTRYMSKQVELEIVGG
jgi:hypothetical protein